MSSEGVLEPLEGLAPLQGAPREEAQARWRALPWRARVLDALGAYLPMLTMGLLALGSWWLVKNTPLPEQPRAAAPPRHDPDYSMHDFSVQRFTSEGVLRAQIKGQTLRHFPDTDTLEVEQPSVEAYSPDSSTTLARARRAISNADASEVQLLGDAHVTRNPPTPGEAPLAFRGEFLHAFLKTERLRSHLPVTLTHGASTIRADSFDYDHLARTVTMKGHVKATFTAPSMAKASARAAS